mgnify:CR=1 FL=1
MGRLRVKRYGTRTEVMNGTARMTQGRLTKDDFVYNEYGYIVSKVKSKAMKGKENPLRQKGLLQNKKGVFGPKKSKKQVRNDFKKKKVSHKKNKNKNKKHKKRSRQVKK